MSIIPSTLTPVFFKCHSWGKAGPSSSADGQCKLHPFDSHPYMVVYSNLSFSMLHLHLLFFVINYVAQLYHHLVSFVFALKSTAWQFLPIKSCLFVSAACLCVGSSVFMMIVMMIVMISVDNSSH